EKNITKSALDKHKKHFDDIIQLYIKFTKMDVNKYKKNVIIVDNQTEYDDAAMTAAYPINLKLNKCHNEDGYYLFNDSNIKWGLNHELGHMFEGCEKWRCCYQSLLSKWHLIN
ncbi:MAG: hypothetical protein ACEQSR_16065, partial [Candidatus Methylacidiphilales bacterium]